MHTDKLQVDLSGSQSVEKAFYPAVKVRIVLSQSAAVSCPSGYQVQKAPTLNKGLPLRRQCPSD